MKILGIPLDCLTQKEVKETLHKFLAEPRLHHITTVNPEFLLLAEKNTNFRTALLTADLRVVDGFGIVLAGLLRGRRISRFPGADLMAEILGIANEQKLSVALIVNKRGLSSFEEIQSAILQKYPAIKISGGNRDVSSYHTSFTTNPASIILCNFGIPHQEIFLQNLKYQDPMRIAMGVGGSLDYLTGKQKRAPRFLRIIGLEWLWRLIQQPKRWRRIWNAVIIFPFRILSAIIQK